MISREFIDEVNGLSFALFRVAESVDHIYLRGRIESRAVDFVELAISRDKTGFIACVAAIRNLISLASQLSFINERNKNTIIEKLDDFEYMVGSLEQRVVDVNDILNRGEMSSENSLKKISAEDYSLPDMDEVEDNSEEMEIDDFSEMMEKSENMPENEDDHDSSEISSASTYLPDKEESSAKKTKADERRGKVFEKIRQNGISFVRDLTTYFPSYSERTLRYDLEKLIEEGKVEKIGNSGPGTFYRSLV